MNHYVTDKPLPPGRAFAIWAFVLAFLVPVLGLVFGVIALVQSRRADGRNPLAVAAIVISILVILAAVVVTIAIATTVGFTAK